MGVGLLVLFVGLAVFLRFVKGDAIAQLIGQPPGDEEPTPTAEPQGDEPWWRDIPIPVMPSSAREPQEAREGQAVLL